MKKLWLLFFALLFSSLGSAKTIEVTISDRDIKILEDSILDVEVWINNAVRGKINKSAERIIRKEQTESLKSGTPLPGGRDAIIDGYIGKPGYKNRKERELERNSSRPSTRTP